jgi:TonB family protein
MNQMKKFLKFSLFLSISLIFHNNLYAQESPTEPTPDPKDMVMGKAINLARPLYSREAVSARVSGIVKVKIKIDEQGNVIEAKAETGNAVLHPAAEHAASNSKFTPTTLSGKPIRVTATISFNFKLFDDWEGIAATLGTLEQGKGGKGYGKRASEINWQGFEDERKELDALQKDETTDGKAERAKRLIASITEKLRMWNSLELWYFNLGLLSSRLSETAEKIGEEPNFRKYFKELDPLIKTAPLGVPQDRLDFLGGIVKNFSKAGMKESNRTEIVRLLVESYNKKLTTLQ